MWFKNLKIFQLSNKLKIDDEVLVEKLQAFAFQPCSAGMPQSVGWISVTNTEQTNLLYSAMGYKMICLKIEEKILPSTVLSDKTQERVKEIEILEDRQLSKREKASIKDQLYFSLIQQAFCRSTKIYAYFDTHKNWFIVNCTNAKKLEIFNSYFKKSFPSIELVVPEIKNIPKLAAQWLLSNRCPNNFLIENSAVLEDFQDIKRVIRIKNQDLFHDSIQDLIKEGCVPKQISLTWLDRVNFNLNHDMSLTSLKYDDAVVAETDDGIAETEAERFDADFLIMTQTLQNLMQELLDQIVVTDNKIEAVA